MAYRKINVEGLECEYTIGKTFAKIRIPGHETYIIKKEYIGEPYSLEDDRIEVTPKHIRHAILTKTTTI